MRSHRVLTIYAQTSMEWLTEEEAAAYLKVSPKLLMDGVKSGLLPGHPFPCSRSAIYRFLQHELDDALLEHSAQSEMVGVPSRKGDATLRESEGRPGMNQHLTEKAAAALLSIPAGTLRYWRSIRVGPGFVRLGRSIRYDVTELEAYLDQHRHAFTARKPFLSK